ncbi:hypothetical protein OAJ83_02260 [Candidatus Nitrosopelagicus sp.]|nr:hypothetical protein [Candidatus Nitrosopelagicus sp.]
MGLKKTVCPKTANYTEKKQLYKIYYDACRFSQDWKEVSFDGFKLIGQGQSKQYCQKWVSYLCDNHKSHPGKSDYLHNEQKTCKVSNCPLCFDSWVSRQASRTTRRVSKFMKIPIELANGKTIKKQWHFKHVVLSPDPSKAQKMTYKELKKNLDFALKIANIKTACVVFHPFRFADKDKMIPYVSPHFHCVVYGKITNTTEFYNKMAHTKMNWTITNFHPMKTDVELFSNIRYLLSHCGVRKSTHTVRYLGDISYRNLKVEKEPETHVCPYCHLPLTIGILVPQSEHEPPPLFEKDEQGKLIGFTGLIKHGIFQNISFDEDDKIPFYDLVDDSNPKSIVEEMIYSFEDVMFANTSQANRTMKKYERSLMKHYTSITSRKITEF